MHNGLWCLLLVACGDNRMTGDDAPGGGDLIADLSVRQVATFAPENVQGIAIAALDDHRLAIARADQSGTAFCPDCIDLDPSECPTLCERSQIVVSILDTRDGSVDAARPVATVFPASFDHSVDQVEVVALVGDRVGVGWLDCDNSTCLGMFAKRSCTARYTTVDLATGALGTTQTLYTGWFGDLSLAFEPTTKRLLALAGKDLAFGAGIFRALFDETGATTLSPWTALGSTAARSPAILATAGEFLIVADDWSPARPPLATPCAESCNCLAAGKIDLETGGLFAFHVGGAADRVEQIAGGRDPRGFYGRREQLAVIDAGGRTMVAATQSIDRVAEVFTHNGSTWTLELSTPAPIPLWIGALGTADHLAWLGTQPEPGESATVQRLVAGIFAGEANERSTLGEPVARYVFMAVPIATPAGVTTTFLLQGLFARIGSEVSWDRFELIAVDADWR